MKGLISQYVYHVYGVRIGVPALKAKLLQSLGTQLVFMMGTLPFLQSSKTVWWEPQ